LEAWLKEKIYLKLPKGCYTPGYVYLMRRSLYGLCQSGFEWNKDIDKFLLNLGFTRSHHDPCLYVMFTNSEEYDDATDRFSNPIGTAFMWLVLYCDDFPHASNSIKMLKWFENKVLNRYSAKIGKLDEFLGIRVQYNRSKGIGSLDQEGAINELLDKYNYENIAPRTLPAHEGTQVSWDTPVDPATMANLLKHPFAEINGSLLWIQQCTRPDISCIVQQMCRVASPDKRQPEHIEIQEGAIAYTAHTKGFKLYYHADCPGSNTGYATADSSDSDCIMTSKSRWGFGVSLNWALVLWKVGMSPTVPLSTFESETIALSQCNRVVCIYFRGIMAELFLKQQNPTCICQDNRAAIALATSQAGTKKSKHIRRQYHYNRECFDRNEMVPVYQASNDMASDDFTKCVGGDKHGRFTSFNMGYVPAPIPFTLEPTEMTFEYYRC